MALAAPSREAVVHPWTAVPGPTAMPLLGSFGNFLKFMDDPIAYLRRLHAQYGSVAAMTAADARGMAFAFGPDYNRVILSQPTRFLNAGITHLGPHGSANRRVSFGMLNMNGAEHQYHRKIVSPFFQPAALAGRHQTMVELTDRMLNAWIVERPFDVSEVMSQLIKSMSFINILGLANTEEFDRLAQTIEAWRAANFSAWARAWPMDLPGTPHRRMLRTAEALERVMQRLIARRRAAGTDGAYDVFALLLRNQAEDPNRISDERLVGQLVFMYGASYDTTASALAWTLFLISQHPKVMARIDEEGRAALGGAPPTIETITQLHYLDRVIKESLRLLAPPVYSVRVTSERVALGAYEAEKGTPIAFSHYITHHLPQLYPEPERFLPDRWETIQPSPYEYLPFGAGVHACLGAGLATMTMKIVLSMVVQRFRLTVVPHAHIARQVRITLSARDGIPVVAYRQDRAFERSKTPVRGNIHEMVRL